MPKDEDTDKPAGEDAAPASSPPGPEEAALVRLKWKLFAIVSIVSLVADIATKVWARAALPVMPAVPNGCDAGVVEGIKAGKCFGVPDGFIDSFWHWRLSMNPGASFGLFSSQGGARIFLSIIGVAAVGGMIWMIKKARTDQKILHWALALVAGGAVGNLIDRIYYGVVTDFILWHVGEYDARRMRFEHEWPVFNVADIVLVVGVGLMFIDIYKEGKREKALKAGKLADAKKAGRIKELVP